MKTTAFITKSKIPILAICLVLGFTAHAQNLLLNGSFESPAIPPNTISLSNPASWQGTGASILNGNYGVPEYPGPHDGQQYVAIGGGATLIQAFTITAGGTHLLSWFDNAGNHPDSSPYSVAVLTNGTVIASTNLNASHYAQGWQPHLVRLNLSPGPYSIQFQSLGPQFGLSTLLDAVGFDLDLTSTIHVSAVDICWHGLTDQMYQVQYTTNLGSIWFDLTAPIAGTGTNCVTDAMNPLRNRFYRVVRAP